VRPERRILSRLSLILVLAAVGAHFAAMSQSGPTIITSMKAHGHIKRGYEYADLGMDDWALAELDQAAKLNADVQLRYHRSSLLAQSGLVLFVLAFGCFGVSRCIGERAFAFWFSVISVYYISLCFLIA
jgi:hypothetical protein